jgi:hypothetical protein
LCSFADGSGVYTFVNGGVYDGEWKADKMQGKGTHRYLNGEGYVGDFVDGKMEGKGVGGGVEDYLFPSVLHRTSKSNYLHKRQYSNQSY